MPARCAVRRATDAAHPLRVLSARLRRRRGTPFRIHRRFHYLQYHCNCAFGDHIFSLLREKIWKKRTQENEIALTRRKTSRYILRVSVTPAVKERPSGDRRIGFPERTINCVVAPLAPVKYLTYGNRNASDLKRFVGVDAHIDPLCNGLMWASAPTTLSRTNISRFPYVKYLPRCDIPVYKIGRAARRAFLDHRCNDNT